MSNKLDPAEVAAYLEANPDFFIDRDSLLLSLELPHRDKGTISLVERQLSLLREKQKKSKKQLEGFVSSAQENLEIFNKSKKLVLNLLASHNSDEFFEALEKSFKRDFKCSAYSLIVFDGEPRQVNHFTSSVSRESAQEYVGALMRATKPTLGVIRPAEQDFLFRHKSDEVQSAAILSVKERSKQIALLAIGSADAHYFSSDMDTLFLGFIADVLAKLLPRYMETDA